VSPEKYLDLKEVLLNAGYDKDITWAETMKPPKTALAFFHEYAWVVLNSGMKNQVARGIWYRILGALERNSTFEQFLIILGKRRRSRMLGITGKSFFRNIKYSRPISFLIGFSPSLGSARSRSTT